MSEQQIYRMFEIGIKHKDKVFYVSENEVGKEKYEKFAEELTKAVDNKELKPAIAIDTEFFYVSPDSIAYIYEHVIDPSEDVTGDEEE